MDFSGQQTRVNRDDVMGMKTMEADDHRAYQPGVGCAAGKQKRRARGEELPGDAIEFTDCCLGLVG